MASREYTQLVFEGEPNKRQKFSLVSFPGQYEDEWKLITQQEATPKDQRLASSCVFYPNDNSDCYGEHCKPCLCQKLYEGVHKDYDTWANGQAEFGCFWFHRWKSNVDWVVDRQVAIIVYKAGLVNQNTGLGNSQRGEVAEIRERNLPTVHVDIDEFMEHILPLARTPERLQNKKIDEVKNFLDDLIAEKRQGKLEATRKEVSETLAQEKELQKQRSVDLQEAEEHLRRCQEQMRLGELKLTALQEALQSLSPDSLPQPEQWVDVRTQLEQQGLVGPASLHLRRRQADEGVSEAEVKETGASKKAEEEAADAEVQETGTEKKAEDVALQPPAPEPVEVKQALQELNLDGKDNMSNGIPAEVLARLPTLWKLSMQRCRLNAGGIRELCQALNTNSSLSTLHVGRNEIGVEGARQLAEALKANSSLTTLNLQYNGIGVEGARCLAGALKANSSLTTLNINSNDIGAEGAHCLAEALEVNSTLTTLYLYGNDIGDEGVRCLAEALKANSSLTALSLWNNSIGDDGARCLVEALKINSSLAKLDVDKNRIGDEGARHLAEALEINSSLTLLDVQSNEIGAEGQDLLAKAARPGCEVRF